MSDGLYRILTKAIAQHFQDLKQHNLFYQRIFSGSITVEEFASFIKNVSYLTAHTPLHLSRAIKSAETQGFSNLSRYFQRKYTEETGHHLWGESDLREIESRFGVQQASIPISNQMKSYIKGNEELIDRDPFLYFVYILFAEYFTVIAAPESLLAVQKSCKIPKEMMTIIANHAELDKDHIQQWALEARAVGLDPSKESHYMRGLQEIMQRYDHFCHELSRKYEYAA